MMKLINSFFFVMLMITFVSCNESKVVETPETLGAKIDNLQAELFSDNTKAIDIVKADSMIDMYLQYAETFPEDSSAVEFLFKAAEVQMGIEKNMECISTLSQIQNKYPEANILPMVLHFKAFVYDDKLKDYDKARASLDELIERYPNDNLVPNAKAYREMIGKDPNEMFRKVDSLNAEK